MSSDPDRLRDLGERLDQLQARRPVKPPPNQWAVAGRLATEMVAGLFVGGGMGWGIDWLFGYFGLRTFPAFMIGFLVLGAAAAIRNVIRTAQQMNAEASAREGNSPQP